MALKKLVNPSPDTGADKYFGENINDIVKALTGETEEDITIAGIFTLNNYLDQQVISAPGAPESGYVRCYPKAIDANNHGYFVQMKKAGSIVEVQIA